MAMEQSSDLVRLVVLLGAGVVAVPLFRRLGLGSVLGYLAAGLAIGPFGLGVFGDAEAVLHVAELGVVMFLFIIGLEMQPSRLWTLRGEIFGAGLGQVLLCGGLLTGVGLLAGLAPPVAFLAAMGFALTSTAMVMQMLEERGETGTPRAQRIVSILLLEDLAIVPLLAIVALLSPLAAPRGGMSQWATVGIALVALAGLVGTSRFLLTPLFSLLAKSRAREVMTAAALLVVLGAALSMQATGLSMAMGAFAAGVMLSESPFRRQLEADIEPFRGILLGLFFMGVGMSLDLHVVAASPWIILAGVVACKLAKALGIFAIARIGHADWREAVERTALMSQGGEFAFVLYAAAAAAGIFTAQLHAQLAAIVILSMALTPPLVLALRFLPERRVAVDMTGVESVQAGAKAPASVVMVGFGRFGQVASQALLARGFDITIIEKDTDGIRAAAGFGFKVFYGDGTRWDVMRASGAAEAPLIMVCTDKPETTLAIVGLLRRQFPMIPVMARAFDRPHAIALIDQGVDYQMRETLESAFTFGSAALDRLGVPEEEVEAVMRDIRRRDIARLELEIAGEVDMARSLIHGNKMVPKPLTRPQREARALSEETIRVVEEAVEAGD
jgi:glutathione-regulated potassium-efflux system protein KefB